MANVQAAYHSLRAGLGASLRIDKNEKYVFTKFRESIVIGDAIGGAVGAGDAAVNNLQCGPYAFNYRLEQALAGNPPRNSLDGLLFVVDAADNDGFEMNLGRTLSAQDTTINTNSNGAFKIATDAAFFLKVQLDIGVVANADQICAGFSVGGYPADGDLDTYTDAAVFNVDQGQLNIETILNNGATTVTDTTVNIANNDQPSLEVRVDGTGLCKFLYNGAAPATDITTFSFDSGDVVHAFISVLEDAPAADPVVSVMSWESGFISSRGLIGIGDLFEQPQSD